MHTTLHKWQVVHNQVAFSKGFVSCLNSDNGLHAVAAITYGTNVCCQARMYLSKVHYIFCRVSLTIWSYLMLLCFLFM